ncbi:class I SAM-dependent DNA methyltransferase [Nocardia sp. NPDC052566]|uniref:class I SAM-dependent DNA methyltransferase n=1 Tax=Nocardia sp. NPDC052566 TaxID=3364330 RepID=UPI0037CAB990
MGTRDSYDEIADEYANRFWDELDGKPLDRALLNVFAGAVGADRPAADIGCGPGHIARYLRDRGVPMVGVDLSPRMIDTAATAHPDIEFHVGDMTELPFPDQFWGGIVAFYSIIHVAAADLPAAFGEFYRTLHPGAPLLLSFHMGDEIRHFDDLWGHPVDLDFRFYERPMIESLLQKAGFTISATVERQAYPAEVPTTRAYLLAHRPA